MSTMQRMTLLGLYNHDNSLFDAMTLPEGYDKNILIETLLMEHGEKCVLYPNPEFMKYSIGVVSRKWENELERIFIALTEEYNPLWNFDRNEEWEDHAGRKWGEKDEADYDNTLNRGTSDIRTPDLTELTEYGKKNTHEQLTNGYTEQKTNGFTEQTTNGYNEQKTDGYSEQLVNGYTEQTTAGYNETDIGHKAETEELVSAFNSSNYEPSKKTITDNGKTMTSSGKVESSSGKIGTSIGKVENSQGKIENSQGKIENSDGKIQDELSGKDSLKTTGSDITTHTGFDKTNIKGTLSDKNGAETNNSSHKGHLWGNIGVTTSSQLALEETQLRMRVNLYGTAAQIFANELLIMIY